jgi:hypothetical protein
MYNDLDYRSFGTTRLGMCARACFSKKWPARFLDVITHETPTFNGNLQFDFMIIDVITTLLINLLEESTNENPSCLPAQPMVNLKSESDPRGVVARGRLFPHFSRSRPLATMMLSFLLSLLAILVAVAAPLVTAQTTAENFISDTIAALQGSEPEILNLNALLTEGSYQSQARTAVLGILGKNIGIDKNAANEILQFYALACIYFATNGASNKFTDLVTPGCPVPTWTVDDWLLPRHYCQWTGVTCNDVQNAVVAIDLASNQLHGTFPPEVVLLKASLQRINVANNELHTSQDPKWLYRMAELQYLYFGSTSWEYPGVPQYLSGARKLSECFDFFLRFACVPYIFHLIPCFVRHNCAFFLHLINTHSRLLCLLLS